MNFTNELYHNNFKVQQVIDKYVIFMLDDDMLRLVYYTHPDDTHAPHMHVYSYQSDDIFKIAMPPSLDSALLQQLLNDPLRTREIIDCTSTGIGSLRILKNA